MLRWVFALPLFALGCAGGAATPEAAFLALERAVAAGDAGAFYELLTPETRSAVEDTWRAERLQRTIVEAKFPPDKMAGELARLAPAEADGPRAYFVAVATARQLVVGYRKRLGSVSGPVKTRADGADAVWVARADGMPFRFVKGRGGWAFAELERDWAVERAHATHAVRTVRENAALYRGDDNGARGAP